MASLIGLGYSSVHSTVPRKHIAQTLEMFGCNMDSPPLPITQPFLVLLSIPLPEHRWASVFGPAGRVLSGRLFHLGRLVHSQHTPPFYTPLPGI